MPRPIKDRIVMDKPSCCKFIPEKIKVDGSVKLSLDELDVIRKCDYERLSQENCANAMKISRTTVQRIYASARTKIAEALVLGKILEIDGGHVHLMDESELVNQSYTNEKGEINMKIAIGIDGDKVANHFGHCNDFRIIEVVDNKVISQSDIHDETRVHQERPQFLKDLGIDVLIMNTMGKGAFNRLIALNIETVYAENKSVEDAIESYLNKTLNVELVGHECVDCGSHDHKHEGHKHG
jgi:predicted DNA-binding protein (UPF0251 family)/predicted Fe-Mo cluster-binding NifX family protein